MMIQYGLHGAQPSLAAKPLNHKRSILLAALMVSLLSAGGASAQVPNSIASPTPQFDVTGFIQAATLEPAGANPSMCPLVEDPLLKGGTVTINGITMIVPCNTILQMPANTITWAMLFPTLDGSGNVIGSFASPTGTSTVALNGQVVGQAAGQTGLALSDSTSAPGTGGPFPSFEMRAIGNIVNGQYIIGLIVPISQQNANAGFGQVTCIDYVNSFLYVGGVPAAAGQVGCLPANGVRLQINDPIGRWGIAHSPDQRFSGDTNNTTIHAATGFPMCVPRVDPAAHRGAADGGDPLCPAGNRPLNGDVRFPIDLFNQAGVALKIFKMPAPPPTPNPLGLFPPPDPDGNPVGNAPPANFPDARQQAPFMVGDWINYSGTVAKDSLQQSYISAHTIIANLGIFTTPGTKPTYISVETILLGAEGTPVDTLDQEVTTRIFIVGFTTDPINLVDVNAVDVDPCTGNETLRLLGTADPTTQVLASRFRFHVLGGHFMPPTREMIIASENGTTIATDPVTDLLPGFPAGVSNGLGSGQYRLPNFDFIFPENLVLGEPIVPNNFQDLPFLAQGSGPLFGGGPLVGQLTPWPGLPVPAPLVCSSTPVPGGFAPIVFAGFDRVVASGLSESFIGTITEDPTLAFAEIAIPPTAPPPTIVWTQTAGPNASLAGANTLTPSYSTVGIAPGAHLAFQLSVTDVFGTGTAVVNVSVVDPATVDVLTPSEAVFRSQKLALGKGALHKVGGKGGLLKVSAVDSVVDRTITMFVDGWGQMSISTVSGLPTYTLSSPGLGRPDFGPPPNVPATVTIHSSRGGESANVPVTIK
jgi:hypothetical protein